MNLHGNLGALLGRFFPSRKGIQKSEGQANSCYIRWQVFPVNVTFTVYGYEYKHITASTVYPKFKIQ